MKKRKWVWIVLFIISVTLITLLATSWNLILVYNPLYTKTPWWRLVLGSLGYALVFFLSFLLLWRLLLEMRINQMQSEFLARVSHELKSPITSLELTSDLLKRAHVVDEEEQKLWKIHDTELRRLKLEVDLILESFRYETKKYKPELVLVNLEDWIQKSMLHWKIVMGEKSLIEKIGVPLNVSTEIDPKVLQLITNNFVDNARKFSKGTATLLVKTDYIPQSKDAPAKWRISFVDSGLGFDPRISKKIFKRFYRGKYQSSKAIAGTGLGLHIAKSAAKSLGLKIKAQSQGINQGATFSIEGEC